MWSSREYYPASTNRGLSGKKQCFVGVLIASMAIFSYQHLSNSCRAEDTRSVKQLYFQSKGGALREPSSQELATVETLFMQVLTGDRSGALADRWAQLGMRMVRTAEQDRHFTVVMEDENRKYGRGFYLFADKPENSIGLFAPHRFTDELTGSICLAMALENAFRSVAWNTVKRQGGGSSPDYWDFAKLRNTYLVALTKAFARAFPSGYHVQLHGYETAKRRTAAGDRSDVILSNGSDRPRGEILSLRDCLKENGFGRVLVYPTDVHELGATKNVSGIILREMGNQGFVHIEMNVELRKRLKDQSDVRRAFTGCLVRELH